MELAARIGQTLLEKNKVYEEKNETLEELLTQANERVSRRDRGGEGEGTNTVCVSGLYRGKPCWRRIKFMRRKMRR